MLGGLSLFLLGEASLEPDRHLKIDYMNQIDKLSEQDLTFIPTGTTRLCKSICNLCYGYNLLRVPYNNRLGNQAHLFVNFSPEKSLL
jgi:hypothetical protein